MKTSDKLLLFITLSVLVIFVAAHLTLYAKYRRGDYVLEKGLDERQFRKYKGSAPTVLSLSGNFLVRIIPSDSFRVESDKLDDKPAPGNAGKQWLDYQAKGDTLFILGSVLSSLDPQTQWQVFFRFPRINIYTGHLKSISLSGGMAVLKGEDRPGLLNTDIIARNELLWIGQSDENADWKIRTETYDSVRIYADSSKVVFQKNAIVKN